MKELILEKFAFKFSPSWSEGQVEVKVYKNPGYEEFKKIIEATEQKEIRGIVVINAIYIWDASLANHNDVGNELGFNENEGFLVYFNYEKEEYKYIEADPKHYDNKDHPMIKRMLGMNRKNKDENE